MLKGIAFIYFLSFLTAVRGSVSTEATAQEGPPPPVEELSEAEAAQAEAPPRGAESDPEEAELRSLSKFNSISIEFPLLYMIYYEISSYIMMVILIVYEI